MKKSFWYFEANYYVGDGHPFGGIKCYKIQQVIESQTEFFPLMEAITSFKKDSKSKTDYNFLIIQEISEADYLSFLGK